MRLLFLTSRVPYPIEKGDKLRVFNIIKELSKYHEIHLFAIDEAKTSDESINILKKYCKSIELFPINKCNIACNILKGFFKGLPLQVSFYTSNKGINTFKNYYKKVNPDHIFCQLLRVTEYVKDIDTDKTIDIQDTMSINIARSSNKRFFLTRPIFNIEAKRLKKYENQLFDLFDNKIIISEADRVLYPHEKKDEIHIVPNGVDYSHFTPDNDIPKDIDLIFTGNMGYKPNVDAALFLINDVMPLVFEKKPNFKIAIVGANPHKSLISKQNSNIIITGWVDSIKDYYSKAKIFIAPMRIGTGLQNKLLEAMAMQVPCITTPLANKALKANDGTEILVGDDKESLAKHILSLIDDKEFADTIAANGNRFVKSTYNWSTVGENINKIISKNH